MNNKGKKTVTSLAVLAGLVSGVGALNMFVNRTVKSIIYRHHKDDDKPSILETKYKSKNIYIKNKQDIRLRGILIEETKRYKNFNNITSFCIRSKRYVSLCSVF